MKVCPHCGVEFEEDLTVCPLCHFSEAEDNLINKTRHIPESDMKQSDKLLYGYTKLTQKEKRKLFWEISMIILFSGTMVTAVIDLISTSGITWSKYSITVCMVLFANATLFSFLRHKLFMLLTGSFITTSLLMVMLDVYNEGVGWGTQLGIPLLFSVYIVIFILAVIFRTSRQHGFNLLGCLFLAAGIITVFTDVIISWHILHKLSIHWSLIVTVCIIPIAGILFYIHYRLNKGVELRRFFHI